MNNTGNAKQNIVLIILFAAAWIIPREQVGITYFHELLHYSAAQYEGKWCEITSDTTVLFENPSIQMATAGWYGETLLPILLFVIFFFISSPRAEGLRSFYAHLGLFAGYAVRVWLIPLTAHTVDFYEINPSWTQGMLDTWKWNPGLMVLAVIITLVLCRMRRRRL